MGKTGAVRTLALLVVLSVTTPALGDAPSQQAVADTRLADAKARYEKGVDAYTAGRFKDAVDLFLAADRLSPSAPLSFNIARAYEKLGDDSGALRWYRDYVRRAGDAPNVSDVQKLVERFEAKLQAKGVQQLTVLSEPAGATVAVDRTPVGVTPWTADLPPGTHHVALTLRGYRDSESDVELAAEHARDFTAELSRAPAVAAPQAAPAAAAPVAPLPAGTPPAAERAQGGGLGVWPWVAFGAGGATLGGALAFELMRQSSEKAAKDDPTQIGYKENLDKMESRRTTARALASVGGGLVVLGGVLLVVDLTGRKSEKVSSLTLSPAPGGLTGSLAGSF